MDDSQRIHNYNSVLYIIFGPISYEMDEKEIQNHMEHTFSLFNTRVDGGAYKVCTAPNLRGL